MHADLYTDGASRGNPGPSAIGVILIIDNATRVDLSECIGHSTNNLAEYEAIIRGLKLAISKGVSELSLFCDNLVVVNQILGDYAVNSESLREKYDEVHRLLPEFEDCEITWIPREKNKQADGLASRALDREKRNARRKLR